MKKVELMRKNFFLLLSLCWFFSAFESYAETYNFVGPVEERCKALDINLGTVNKWRCPDYSPSTTPNTEQCSCLKEVNGWASNQPCTGGWLWCPIMSFNPTVCTGRQVILVQKQSSGDFILACESYDLEGVMTSGDWAHSCAYRSLDSESGVLDAYCKNYEGTFISTQYDLHTCWTANLWNKDGHLECSSDPAPPPSSAPKISH
jgi:hypothetical protein